VVTPDGHVLNLGDLGTSLESELGEGSVVVESGHGSEVLSWDIGSVVLADHSVSVGRVTDNDGLGISSAVVVNGLTNIDEDGTVILEEVSSLHTGSTGLGTNEEVVVNILEGNVEVASADDIVKERESAIVELSLNTLEDLLLERKIQKVEDNSLVLAEEFTTGNSEEDRVSDLTGSTRDEDSLGIIVKAGVVRGHGAGGHRGHGLGRS